MWSEMEEYVRELPSSLLLTQSLALLRSLVAKLPWSSWKLIWWGGDGGEEQLRRGGGLGPDGLQQLHHVRNMGVTGGGMGLFGVRNGLTSDQV